MPPLSCHVEVSNFAGYGVYQYENKFYKYEGQWRNGFKHGKDGINVAALCECAASGHGKLVMKDGGFYEGTFENGEIEGHGYKLFGISKATYTGQFHRGVMHGQGLMRRPNGEQYEGCWENGKRHGTCTYVSEFQFGFSKT